MSNYVGVRCPVCSKKFHATDDIVVCPVCGAPHHRECYAKEGMCAFTEDHLSGKEWRPPQAEAPSPEEGEAEGDSQAGTKPCPSCGSANPEESIFCQVCGQRLFAQERTGAGPRGFGMPPGMGGFDPVTMQYGGMKPDDEIDGVKVKELALCVGPNAMYYMPRFAHMQRTGSPISPNFAAFFLSFLYFFYRKMYVIGTILLAVFLVGMVPVVLYMREMLPETLYAMGFDIDPTVNLVAAQFYANLVSVSNLVSFITGLSAALFANRLYLNKVMRTVHTLRGGDVVVEEESYRDQLMVKGGVNKPLVITTGVTLFAGFFLLCNYFAMLIS